MTVGLVCRLWLFLELHLFWCIFGLAPAFRFSVAELAAIETLAFELCFWLVFVRFCLGVFAGRFVFVTLALPQLLATLFSSIFSLLLSSEC